MQTAHSWLGRGTWWGAREAVCTSLGHEIWYGTCDDREPSVAPHRKHRYVRYISKCMIVCCIPRNALYFSHQLYWESAFPYTCCFLYFCHSIIEGMSRLEVGVGWLLNRPISFRTTAKDRDDCWLQPYTEKKPRCYMTKLCNLIPWKMLVV